MMYLHIILGFVLLLGIALFFMAVKDVKKKGGIYKSKKTNHIYEIGYVELEFWGRSSYRLEKLYGYDWSNYVNSFSLRKDYVYLGRNITEVKQKYPEEFI